MPIASAPQPAYLHRRHGKLFYNVAALALTVDYIIDANGAPDATQNPDAVFVGSTDAGYEFVAEPEFYEELIDEEDAPVEVGGFIKSAQISFAALEVTDLERVADLLPFGNYSENTVSTVVTQRITAGSSGQIILPAAPVMVVSKAKDGSWIGVVLYAAYNAGNHTLQFKKGERSKQDMVIKALNVPGRAESDRLYREFRTPKPA